MQHGAVICQFHPHYTFLTLNCVGLHQAYIFFFLCLHSYTKSTYSVRYNTYSSSCTHSPKPAIQIFKHNVSLFFKQPIKQLILPLFKFPFSSSDTPLQYTSNQSLMAPPGFISKLQKPYFTANQTLIEHMAHSDMNQPFNSSKTELTGNIFCQTAQHNSIESHEEKAENYCVTLYLDSLPTVSL